MIRNLAQALRTFVHIIANSGVAPADFDAKLVELLQGVTQDTELVVGFAGYLRNCYTDPEVLLSGLNDFLVAIKCASATDRTLFAGDQGEVDDIQGLALIMEMVTPEQRDALAADSLDLAAMRANSELSN
jgi:hypothetical protein